MADRHPMSVITNGDLDLGQRLIVLGNQSQPIDHAGIVGVRALTVDRREVADAKSCRTDAIVSHPGGVDRHIRLLIAEGLWKSALRPTVSHTAALD
jgi:hypothetical protein